MDFKYSTSEVFYLSVALIATFIVSMIVIKKLLEYLKKNDFQAFGWYRVCLSTVIVLYFLIK